MHILPIEWSSGSWTYRQVTREGDLAIYRQNHKIGRAERFEVIVVQHIDERPLPNGRVQEAGEYYPRSSQWGVHGWTHFTLAEAETQMALLLQRGGPPDGQLPRPEGRSL